MMAKGQDNGWRDWLGQGAIAALSLLLIGCGPSRAEQCLLLYDTIQAAESQQALGQQTPATTQQNATLYEDLAATLSGLELTAKPLKAHRDDLVSGYQALAVVLRREAEVMNEDGTISYVLGDTEAEQAYKSLSADKQKAHNQVITASELYSQHCAR
ncbi:MAG: hypothetical protein ACFB0C_11775 [Leptolyngbyaceae cyanobacterium]